MRLTVISEDAESLLVTAEDVIGSVEAIGKVRLPGTFQPKDRQYRRDVAKRLAKTSLRQGAGTGPDAPLPDKGSIRSSSIRICASGSAPRRRSSAWRATGRDRHAGGPSQPLTQSRVRPCRRRARAPRLPR